MSQHKVDFESVVWETPMSGLRFKAARQGGRQLRLVEFTKNMEPHWCEKGHIGFVLEGQLEIKYEGEVAIYNPGDGILIPSGPEHKHMGRVLSDIVRVVLVEDV